MKLQLAEQGIRMKVKSLKKPRYDGFVKIDPKLSKKKNNFQDEPDEEFRHLIIYL